MPHERSMGLRSETGEFFMRAIFINAVDRKVEEIQIENELHAFYERIGCDMIHHDIRERLQAKLMMAVLTFKAEE